MFGQGVEAEIRGRITPDRVHVVRPALGVVVLDQQRGPLNPVVLRILISGPAGPRERQCFQGIIIGKTPAK